MRLAVYCFLAVLVFGVMIAAANAQDGHARWHHYYQNWKQPGTTISCCNARVNVMGVEMGDCEPVPYRFEKGEWHVWVRQENRWMHVPDDRIIKERNPSSEEFHFCYNPYTKAILCAVPPDTGG